MSLQETLQKEYANRFSGLETYRDHVWQVLCGSFFNRYVRPGDTVIDVGAGYGEFIRNIQAGTKHALDLNPDTASSVSPDTRFHQQDCSHPWPIEAGSVDVVFTSNFLEHLPDKAAIERTLEHAWSSLKHDGTLICLGPNIRYVPGDYWDFWDHHVPISDSSLTELLSMKGFRVMQRINRFLPYTMSGGLQPTHCLGQALPQAAVFVANCGQAVPGDRAEDRVRCGSLIRRIDSEFLRFLLSGGFAAAVNWTSRILFSLWLNYSLAIVLAFITGLVTAFLLFREYVFDPGIGSVGKSFSIFVIINLIALLLTWGVSITLAFHVLPAIGWTFFPFEVAHGVGVAAPVIVSYFGHKHITFR